jgi:hypothetical protein
MANDPSFHRWRDPQRLVNTREIVPRKPQRMGRFQVLQLLTEGARQPCHAPQTAYLKNVGLIENALAIAAHKSPCTTKPYDRTSDEITWMKWKGFQFDNSDLFGIYRQFYVKLPPILGR